MAKFVLKMTVKYVEQWGRREVPGSITGMVLGKFSRDLFLLSAFSNPGTTLSL
jgi:putative effector of murein hydrolase LrgA (UPF0299 family)